jgi:N-acetylglutamate synthase-like GNAT family acetyltransferase
LAGTFRSINEEWIQAMFSLEESDRRLLEHPLETVIVPGGRIWFVEHDELGLIGTAALIKRAEGVFELTKMGVLASARGARAGAFLLEHVIDEACAAGIDTLFLLTSTRCQAAIHLYLRFGFDHDAEIMRRFGASYERCDVAMRWVERAAESR